MTFHNLTDQCPYCDDLDRMLNAAHARITQLEQALALARQFVSGDMRLQCLPSETDRECMNRVKGELLKQIDHMAQAPKSAPDRASEDRGTQWRDIAHESAPENIRILVYGYETEGHDEAAMAWFDRIDRQFYYAPQGGIIQWTITHWQPLPEPPGSAVGQDAVSVPRPDEQNAVDERPAEESVPRGMVATDEWWTYAAMRFNCATNWVERQQPDGTWAPFYYGGATAVSVGDDAPITREPDEQNK